jgi:carbonic anhydrase
MTEKSTIDRLLAGFRSFRSHYYERRPQLFDSLQQGQHPEVMVIACSDSRVDPAILTQSEPGELFVVRNVANIVPPFKPDGLHHGTSAALEFAVRDLGVSYIIILGHSQCGGIQELVKGLSEQGGERDFIEPWMSVVAGACAHHVDDGKDDAGLRDLREVEQASIRISTANLMTYPWIREKVEQKTLGLYGWWFDLNAGKLWTVRAGSEKAARLS